MKKFFAFAACALVLAGCDFVGGTTDAVASVSNITINDAAIGTATSIRVEVQDVAGRAYSSSDHAVAAFPLSLDMQFDVFNGSRDLAIIVMADNGAGAQSRYTFLAASDQFDGDALAAAAGTSVEVGGSVSATIDVAGLTQ